MPKLSRCSFSTGHVWCHCLVEYLIYCIRFQFFFCFTFIFGITSFFQLYIFVKDKWKQRWNYWNNDHLQPVAFLFFVFHFSFTDYDDDEFEYRLSDINFFLFIIVRLFTISVPTSVDRQQCTAFDYNDSW